MSVKTIVRRVVPALLLLCAALGLWLHARGAVRLISAPPPQLAVGETALLLFSSARSGAPQALSNNETVAGIQVQSVSDGVIACAVTARADGTAVLSCTIGGRQSPAYAVSVVPPALLPLTAGEFVASTNSKIFHQIDCSWAGKIQKENRVYFARAEDAQTDGYAPCTRCLKP